MNSNELTYKVMEIVANQIEPIVTEYMKEHPEYFHNCVHGSGKICQHEITLSYQPKSLTAIADMNAPAMIAVRVGGIEIGHELIKFDDCASMESRWYINGDRHIVKGRCKKMAESKFTVDGSTVSDKEIPNV